ncbi:hypothetical protein SAMN05421509_10950 [Chromohalobacter canadensis]|uniref:Uncharacterized protein n=1 Tax=Chromohalobacter canadensis TaxID=141389 RepID=A0A285VU01_9GAMM|nr:hypothetical protein SAMN05421509_10950 [Chromohalobacter canadensis]
MNLKSYLQWHRAGECMMVYRFQYDVLARPCRIVRNLARAIRSIAGEALFRCFFFEACIFALYILLGALVVPFALVLGFYKVVRYVLAKVGGRA